MEKWVEKLKKLHKQKTGLEISDQTALEHFTKLITLTRAVYRPVPCSDKEEMRRLTPKN